MIQDTAMVFECSQNDFWLNMVPTTELPDGRLGDDGPLASKMYGPFGSLKRLGVLLTTDFRTLVRDSCLWTSGRKS